MTLTAVLEAQLAAPFAIMQRPRFRITDKFLSSQKPAVTGGDIKKMTA